MNKLVILTGPTAVGKTQLSISLAKEIGGEIISTDSMQVYKKMDIGTDKISPEQMQGVPHHLIDVLEPTENFNVKRFQEMALSAMEQIYERGHVPILVGGTGFYIQAVLYGIDFTETDDDPSIRLELEEQARRIGPVQMHNKLKEIDPEAAAAIPAGNQKRVIRALEYYAKTGKKISQHNKEQHEKISPYSFHYFVLTDERPILYERINKRVDQMVERGLVKEVEMLLQQGVTPDMTSMQGLGYREAIGYLQGSYDLERMKELIKQNTRHFAKRQLTWFRREQQVEWIDKSLYHRNNVEVLQEIMKRYEKS